MKKPDKRVCNTCGTEYFPNSAPQKHCDPCRRQLQKLYIKNNHAKNREKYLEYRRQYARQYAQRRRAQKALKDVPGDNAA
jgi:hypothetical protein